MSETQTTEVAREEKYPHVYDWQWAVLDKYAEHLNNTGGNDPEDLLNDIQRPSTDERPNTLMATNVVRFTLASAVLAQVCLLHHLEGRGLLATGEEWGVRWPGRDDVEVQPGGKEWAQMAAGFTGGTAILRRGVTEWEVI